MSEETAYTAKSTIRQIASLHRRAAIATGEEAVFGVHGPMAEHYKLPQSPPLPFPVDYIVAAAGG
jgi:hypothetical protein